MFKYLEKTTYIGVASCGLYLDSLDTIKKSLAEFLCWVSNFPSNIIKSAHWKDASNQSRVELRGLLIKVRLIT